ncbi:MAG: hypothetical protein M3076_09055 [Actinomycetota bacterium]|nr:hypothetical protein [Actinomycetota bacterium]
MTTRSPERAAYAALADRIEAEVRVLGLAHVPAPVAPVRSAFGSGEMSFGQWLQQRLCPRLRAIASGDEDPPPPRPTGTAGLPTYAARNLDGYDDADRLLEALQELDRLAGND